MSVTILPSKSNIEISNAQQIETIETLEMKIESTHVARALFIAWKYLSGRHFVLFIYWSATLWAWIEIYEPFHFGTAKRITMTTSLDPLIPQNGTHAHVASILGGDPNPSSTTSAKINMINR
jgi:hypothetical protein